MWWREPDGTAHPFLLCRVLARISVSASLKPHCHKESVAEPFSKTSDLRDFFPTLRWYLEALGAQVGDTGAGVPLSQHPCWAAGAFSCKG